MERERRRRFYANQLIEREREFMLKRCLWKQQIYIETNNNNNKKKKMDNILVMLCHILSKLLIKC